MKSRSPTRFYEGATYALDESVGQLLVRISALTKRLADQRMSVHGLTSAQWKPLWMLETGKGSTAQELTCLMNSDAGATTRMLDRLEAKGLITRERSADDRRVVQLKLTDAGREAVRDVPYVLAELNNQALRGFTRAEFEQFKDYLLRVYRTLQEDTQSEGSA